MKHLYFHFFCSYLYIHVSKNYVLQENTVMLQFQVIEGTTVIESSRIHNTFMKTIKQHFNHDKIYP